MSRELVNTDINSKQHFGWNQEPNEMFHQNGRTCFSGMSPITLLLVLTVIGHVSSRALNLTTVLKTRDRNRARQFYSVSLVDLIFSPFLDATQWYDTDSFNATQDVSFNLHTTDDPDEHEELLLYDKESLKASQFNTSHPTRVIVHGWMGSGNSLLFWNLVPAYHQRGNYNVIAVDWGRGAIADYESARRRVKSVGVVLAKFIDFLHDATGVDMKDVFLIGFSMGAHIVGIAGRRIQSGRIPVIFGLDPALPLFSYEDVDERLTSNDADYVEVIHSNAGGYGFEKAIGHADFYVNYGNYQPGCLLAECNHFRAFRVFAESLNSKHGFWAKGCDREEVTILLKRHKCPRPTEDRVLLGGDSATKNLSGVFYLKTNDGPPFARGRTKN